VGGGTSINISTTYLTGAELYDPTAGSWSATSNGPGVASATATLLQNGKVLVFGGTGSSGPTANTEIYDPATGIWTPTGSLLVPQSGSLAVLLPNGNVLAIGSASDAEIYAP
jgi:hypothetical protein